MTEERKTELKRLADAATPGPWVHRGCRYDDDLYSDTAKPGDPYFNHQRISCGGSVRVTMCDMGKLDDLWFILESRTAVLELLDALEEAEHENDTLRARVEALIQSAGGMCSCGHIRDSHEASMAAQCCVHECSCDGYHAVLEGEGE